MVFVLPHLHVFLLFLLPISSIAQNNGNVTVGKSLTATDNTTSWLSPSGDFAFGFRPLNNQKDHFLLSIWFDKIPDKTVVWYARDDQNIIMDGAAPVPRGSKVELDAVKGLVLTDPQGDELWRSNTIVGAVSYGVMSNTGNFVLQDSNSNNLWESFNKPTDTLLPSQIVERSAGVVLYSRQSETNFSKGRFLLKLQDDGDLVLNSINLPTDNPNDPYYKSGTADDSGTSSPGARLVFNNSGYNIYIQRGNNQTVPLKQEKLGSTSDFYFRATLNFDGVFTQYSRPKTSNTSGSWTALWSIPDNICLATVSNSGSSTCGYNSICTLKADLRPKCDCPMGYSLLDPTDQYGSCQPDFPLGCQKENLSPEKDLYSFGVLIKTDWPNGDYAFLKPYTEDQCKQSCMEDCMCAVAIFRLGDSCWKKKLPLSNGRVDNTLGGGKAFIKIRNDNGTITLGLGASLPATDNSSWFSHSGDFAFGFRQINNTNLFLLSIWYTRIPDETIVWYANGDTPAPSGSQVKLTADNGLVLTSPHGQQLWSSQKITGNVAYGLMNDAGNFELKDSNSNMVWQSFSNPTDTILPTQSLERGGVLSSRQSETNFSRGRFQVRFLDDGNLVFNTINLPSTYANDPPYYESGTIGDNNNSSPGIQLALSESGYMYIMRENKERFVLAQGVVNSQTDYYYKATLDFDGVFTLYSNPKTSTGNWTVVWSVPENICTDIFLKQGTGACGFNSICTLKDSRPTCKCPPGYSLMDPNDQYSSCKPDFIQGCEEDKLSSTKDIYSLEELTFTDWPTSDYIRLQPFTEVDCRKSCLQDCMCAVAMFTDGETCWKKKLPLSNGRYNSNFTGKAFIKVRKDNSVPKKKNQESLIILGSVLIGSSVFVNFILIGAIGYGFFFIYKKKRNKINRGFSVMDINLRCFTYKELLGATNGFKEELGKGAFGIVYKGAIQMDSNIPVAVKKLNRFAQDSEKEFKAELNIIGKTHHKNLVRLIGFCDEGLQRLLVYEFLSNGSLAGFLFGDLKPNWTKRIQIAFGIARGLLYLHEECSTQIIHCDIKPHNILLDKYYNAQISDFGLAKLLMMDQSHTHTTIRGTKGYVAPEWFRNMPITAKVDVYSFGVMLMEIICCRKSVDMESGNEETAILTDWAYDCFREGALGALVEHDKEALEDIEKLERFLMIAIWCIQEVPSLRPTMGKVMQMLEGVVDVPVPPCPFPFTTTMNL